MGIKDCIGKKYKLATSEKFDDYMKAVGKCPQILIFCGPSERLSAYAVKKSARGRELSAQFLTALLLNEICKHTRVCPIFWQWFRHVTLSKSVRLIGSQ